MNSALLNLVVVVVRGISALSDLSVSHELGHDLLDGVSEVAEVGVEVPHGERLGS